MGEQRGARALTIAALALMAACGGGGAKGDASTGGTGGDAVGGRGDAVGGSGGDGGGGGNAGAMSDAGNPDAGLDAKLDLATDFGVSESDGAVTCPTGTVTTSAVGALIDDFRDSGKLNGRLRQTDAFTAAEQFDATPNAKLDFTPRVETTCGALTPGAAHIRGTPVDAGATFAIVFGGKSAAGAKAPAFFDASATSGLVFYVALGDAKATTLFTVQVNLADSQWDYTADVVVAGTAWQKVEVRWADLQAAPAAPTFSAAKLNQIVFPFVADAPVDLYLDDVAFLP
jgi:hypothetical protein